MLDVQTFKKFIGKANVAHQQLSLWFNVNNKFAKYQNKWNLDSDKIGCKYKNFWSIIIPSIQQGYILSTAKLFDPVFSSFDKKHKKPRVSLYLIINNLNDKILEKEIMDDLKQYRQLIKSIKIHRNNYIGHNDLEFTPSKIEPGSENLFEWLESVIKKIKIKNPHLNDCGFINIKWNEVLAENGVNELFKDLTGE
jgi:hypothetical protein